MLRGTPEPCRAAYGPGNRVNGQSAGFSPRNPTRGAAPLNPAKGRAPWNHSFWLLPGEGQPWPRAVRVGPLPATTNGRIAKGSPLAGDPRGGASWRVRGRRPRAFV